MRVICCGGRDYTVRHVVWTALDALLILLPITAVIDGKARGVDQLVHEWAVDRGIPFKRFPAEWDEFGKAAGPRRNTEMLRENPGAVIAFPGGSGTNMIGLARAHGVHVYDIMVRPRRLCRDSSFAAEYPSICPVPV